MKALSLTKYIAYAFLGILTLSVLAILLALSPVGVNILVNIANNQAGLTIHKASGSFYSQVSLGKVSYSNSQIQVMGDAIRFDIDLNCLFEGEVCIENISARRFEVVLLEDTNPNTASKPLIEYIELPIAAYLNRLSLEQLTVYTQKTAAQKSLLAELLEVNLSAHMHQSLVVNELSVKDATVVVASQSATEEQTSTEPTKNSVEHWIEMLKNVQYRPIMVPEVFVPLNAEVKKLAITKFCLQQVELTSAAKPEFLCTDQTQISGVINRQKVTANIATNPQNQIASSVALKAKVDFADAFSHYINLSLLPNAKLTSTKAEPVVITILGKVSDTSLTISSPKVSNSLLTLSAQLDVTKPSFPLNVELAANNYQTMLRAWFPDFNVPISSLAASVNGNTQAYKLNISANIDTAQASEISLTGVISLSDKFLNISQLKTSGDVGNLNANLQAKLTQFAGADGVSLTSSIGFRNLQVKPLVPQIDSQLNGNISVNASITPTQLWGDLNCSKVQGVLQGVNLSLLCDVAINKAGLVNIKSFTLTQGKNRVAGKGQFELPLGLNTSNLHSSMSTNSQWLQDTKTALQLDLNLVDLSSLYPGASGTIVGKANIKGQANKPYVVANATINKLKFAQLSVQQAQIDIVVDIANDWQTSMNLAATEIWQKTMLAQQVDVNINGDSSSHTIGLNLQHPEYSFSHQISGEATINEDDWQWLGIWQKGVFASAFDNFTLQQPTNIRVNKTVASIKPHCWLSANGVPQLASQISAQGPPTENNVSELANDSQKALCIDQMQYSSRLTEISAKLTYNLKTPLLHYFPDIIQTGTSLPFSTDIELVYSPQKGIELNTYSLMTQANITTSKHKIELMAFVANSSLKDQIVKTNVFAGTKSSGAVGLSSSLNLKPNNRTHKGQLRIDNFLLSPLQRFIPNVEKLTGALVGNILFDGPLIEPKLNGELQINDVELVLDNYPYPITNFNQTVTIADKKANIEGEFELGDGDANYSGVLTLFDKDKPFSFEGEIKGAGMQIAFANNELLASPLLKIAFDPNNFSLKGEVSIPNAQIKIDELPKSAKSPSSDTIIIGKAQEPPLVPIGLDIDVRIILDAPKLKRVTVNALDLKASLGGDVRVQVRQKQDLLTNEFSPLETYVYGAINILDGSYDAYGQNLQVQKGTIFFNGAPSLPQFEITAIRNPLNTDDKVVAGIRISGNPVIPKVELFSQPSMIQARQISYLLRGTDLGGGKKDSQDVMLVNLLVGFGVGNSENGVNRFGKSLGLDSLNVQTAGQGTNTQVQLTGRISDNIQVTYGVGLFDQASEVILRYQLLPQMYLEAKSGATSAVDLFYEWTRGE